MSEQPQVLWSQTESLLFITIEVDEVKIEKLEGEGNKLHFAAKNKNANYEMSFEFFDEIDPESVKYTRSSTRGMEIIILKKKPAYWPRLLNTKRKVHWLKVDFGKWKAENDELIHFMQLDYQKLVIKNRESELKMAKNNLEEILVRSKALRIVIEENGVPDGYTALFEMLSDIGSVSAANEPVAEAPAALDDDFGKLQITEDNAPPAVDLNDSESWPAFILSSIHRVEAEFKYWKAEQEKILDQRDAVVGKEKKKEQQEKRATLSNEENLRNAKETTHLFAGKHLINQKNEFVDGRDALRGKKIVALYFASMWFNPCRRFTMKLKRFYETLKAAGNEIEVVLVSTDTTEEEFMKCVNNGGDWLAIPFGDGRIKEYLKKYEVPTIPAFKLINDVGKLLHDARADVTKCGEDDAFAVFTEWAEKYPAN